ncbi:hypothetical protein AB0M46_18000 [Dactylosporangium sp. NPDC051485]|uniref:hypothetical protein n=1 Tax=Dactylosporangium sp. NPDC051485 TaxID=3154846 RepID=UPI0034204502
MSLRPYGDVAGRVKPGALDAAPGARVWLGQGVAHAALGPPAGGAGERAGRVVGGVLGVPLLGQGEGDPVTPRASLPLRRWPRQRERAGVLRPCG